MMVVSQAGGLRSQVRDSIGRFMVVWNKVCHRIMVFPHGKRLAGIHLRFFGGIGGGRRLFGRYWRLAHNKKPHQLVGQYMAR
jgi:hypothetical protein